MEFEIEEKKFKASLNEVISDMEGLCDESSVCILEMTDKAGIKIQIHLTATCDNYNFIDEPSPEHLSITQN